MGDISTWTDAQIIIAALIWGLVIGAVCLIGYGLLNIVEYLRDR